MFVITIDANTIKLTPKQAMPSMILNGVKYLSTFETNLHDNELLLLSLLCIELSILFYFEFSAFSSLFNLFSAYLSRLETCLCER